MDPRLPRVALARPASNLPPYRHHAARLRTVQRLRARGGDPAQLQRIEASIQRIEADIQHQTARLRTVQRQRAHGGDAAELDRKEADIRREMAEGRARLRIVRRLRDTAELDRIEADIRREMAEGPEAPATRRADESVTVFLRTRKAEAAPRAAP
jgi:hypothetical protein